MFPLWVALASGLGLAHPPALAWFRAEYTTAALALTMLAMGTSLTFQVPREHWRPLHRHWRVADVSRLPVVAAPARKHNG